MEKRLPSSSPSLIFPFPSHPSCTHTPRHKWKEVRAAGFCSYCRFASLLHPLFQAQLRGAACPWIALWLPAPAGFRPRTSPCWLPWALPPSGSHPQCEWTVSCQELTQYCRPLLAPRHHQPPLISPGSPERQPPSRS